MSGCVHDKLALDGSHPVLLVLGVQLVAGDHQSVHVADGTAYLVYSKKTKHLCHKCAKKGKVGVSYTNLEPECCRQT